MILTSPNLLTMIPDAAPIVDGAVALKRGIILSVGPARRVIKAHPGHHIHRLDHAVLIPGLVNVHVHSELPPLLHIIRAATFADWVLNLIAAKKMVMRKVYYIAASENIREMIKTGTTTVGEICTHGVSPVLLKQSGIRAIVFDEIINMAGHKDQHSSKFTVHSSKLRHSRLILSGISPHTPYTVSEDFLIRVRDLAVQKKVKLAMHIAESKDETRLLQRKNSGLERLYHFADWDLAWAPAGRSSFEYLDRIGVLSPDLLAIHSVQVSSKDIELIRKSKVSVAHCPRSNKELNVGKMPLKKFIDASITVGLGTDSLASVPTLNMWDEMRYAYRIHRRDGISAEDIFRIATIGGAKALGFDKEIGIIEPGKKADIIAVPLPKKNTGDLYSDLLRETKSCIMTMVNGKILYQK